MGAGGMYRAGALVRVSLGRVLLGRVLSGRVLLGGVWLSGALLGGALLGGCGGSSAPSAKQEAFLAAVHELAPDIGSYLSDGRVEALGQATCNDLAAGVGVPAIATRLSSSSLPAPDLGAILSAASQDLCPQYASAFSGGS